MKIAEYKQMMEYLTRPGFNGGGSVRNKTILPKKKPEEEVKKRKIKNFEKAKPALENPKEVKEMIDKPKRGLVDEPGSYSKDQSYFQTYYQKNKEKILKKLKEKRSSPEKEKAKIKKAENVAAWKKANPNLNFDDLSDSMKTRVRQGDLVAGAFQKKPPGIYTISELAEVDGMPFVKTTLQKELVSTKKESKKFQEAFKNAGIEQLPVTKKSQQKRFKMLNATKSMEKLTEYAMTLDRPPKKLVEPYKKQIPIEYKKLVESGKPFSIENLRIKVLEALPENVYKMSGEGSFNAMVKRILTKNQIKKFTRGNILTQTERLQPRKIIIDNILDGKTNIKQLANASNLSEKEIGEQIQRIFRTIYLSREKIGAKQKVKDVILKDYSLDDFEKILTNINKEPTLDSFFRQSYRDFLFYAIGDPNSKTYQPKKYARALERLKAYNNINQKLEEAFGIKLTLDHSLSKGAIKTIQNAEPSQFIRVNPIPESINAGIKKSFDIRYQRVIKDIQSGQFRGEELKNLLIQKAELEKLSKDIGLQFGKISPTGKIIKYDAVDFLNKNLPSEIKAGVSLPNRIRQAVDKIDPTVLKERFKVAFGDKADAALKILDKIKNQDNLQDIYKFLKPLLKVKGLRVDASDFLNQASEVIFPTLQAAEVLPNEAQATTPKPMEFDLDMSLPPKKESSAKTLAGTIGAALTAGTQKGRDIARKVTSGTLKGFGKAFLPLGTPTGTYQFAKNLFFKPTLESIEKGEKIKSSPLQNFGIDVSLPISAVAPTAKAMNLFGPSAGGFFKRTAKDFAKTALGGGYVPRGIDRLLQKIGLQSKRLGPGVVSKFIPNAFRFISPYTTYAAPVVETAIQGYNAYKDLQEARKKYGMDDTVTTALGPAPRKYVQELISELPEVDRSSAAGGGIMKMAGKSSGPPPESGPTPQGLDFLMKRGR